MINVKKQTKKEGNMFTADSMGFFDLPGKLPHIDSLNLVPALDLVHLTSAPLWLTKTEEILKTHIEFVKVLEEEKCCEIIRSSVGLKKFVDSRCRDNQKIGVVLGLQNAPDDVLENNNLKVLYDEGIRIMALAYEEKNSFGGGCMAPKEYLTGKGLELLSAFEKNNIILDISHSGLTTAWNIMWFKECFRFRDLSIFASHSGCYDVYMHNRNITDDIMIKIVKHGGVIGIPTLTFILSKDDDTLNPFLKHIKYVVNLVGEDAVCVGSDGVYKRLNIEELKKHHEKMLKNVNSKYKNEWRARFTEHPIHTYSKYRMLTISDKLREFYFKQAVEKICGLNFLNFLLKKLPFE